MTSPFRFSLQISGFDDPNTVADRARTAEALGYHALFTSDHVGGPDPFLPLMIAADATTTLRLGPLVLNNEFHHPVLLARTAATADRLSGGRLILGLGTGYMQSEHDATDIPLRPPPQRVDRFEESLVALRGLLDDGSTDVDGSHHRLDVADLGVRPTQARLPFLIGGHGRRVVSLAARHGDIFQFTGLVHGEGGVPTPGGFALASLRERRRRLVEAAGDRLDHIECSALAQGTAVGDDTASDRAAIAERTGLDPAVVDETPFVLMGSVEQLVDKIERLRAELGISHYVVRDAEGFAPVVERLTATE